LRDIKPHRQPGPTSPPGEHVVAIHPLAVVHPGAQLGRGVEIGAFAIVEDGVVIGDRSIVDSFAMIKQDTTLGHDNHVFERATIGGLPQHAHMPPRVGRLVIGNHNTIRECATIHRALREGNVTRVGDNNFLMVGVHIAHDCDVGNHTIFANNAMLGGHVTVEDRAYISGNVAVHQFCRIGSLAMVGGLARVIKDVPPFVTVDGTTSYVVGLNTIGLRRNGFSAEDIVQLKAAYRTIYRSGLKWNQIVENLQTTFTSGPAAHMGEFMNHVTRGLVQERRLPPGAGVKLGEEAAAVGPVLQVKAG
jgi:UDP-N-acetylglucosamine acyltransferase